MAQSGKTIVALVLALCPLPNTVYSFAAILTFVASTFFRLEV